MARLLIVNPRATAVDEHRLHAVQGVLPAGTETVLTSAADEATELAREAAGAVEAVYVFGGDGTFNEALNGIDRDTPLGFIPGGGTSVLPRALGLPRDPVAAAERLSRGDSRRIGLGRANGRRFGFAAGIGFDAELVRRVDERGRDHLGTRPGDLTFVWVAVRLIAERRGRWEPVLELKGMGRAAFALFANCTPYTYAGPKGLDFAPEASFDRGVDVIAPVKVGARSLPRLAWYTLRGRGQESADDVLYRHDLDRIEVRCDEPVPMQLDGEDVGDVEAVLVESERDAVAVLV